MFWEAIAVATIYGLAIVLLMMLIAFLTNPNEVAAGAQLVHPGWGVGAQAARKHVAFPDRCGQRHALERGKHFAQPVGPRRTRSRDRAANALPSRQEARELALIGGFDFLAEYGQRGAAQTPQHRRIAPFPIATTGT